MKTSPVVHRCLKCKARFKKSTDLRWHKRSCVVDLENEETVWIGDSD